MQLGPRLDAAEKPGGSENARCGEKWRKVNTQGCCVAPSGMDRQGESDCGRVCMPEVVRSMEGMQRKGDDLQKTTKCGLDAAEDGQQLVCGGPGLDCDRCGRH